MRLLWLDNSAVIKLLKLFLYCSLEFPPKNFESLFHTVFVQDDLICDDAGWWSGLNKGGDIIDNSEIGLGDIVERMGTNSQFDPSHGESIGYSIIVVDSGRIP